MTSTEKEAHFRARANHSILMKDYVHKLFFSKHSFGMTCTNESFTIKPGTCVNKVNRVRFDFILTLELYERL